jgi:protein disulfide-isomerase
MRSIVPRLLYAFTLTTSILAAVPEGAKPASVEEDVLGNAALPQPAAAYPPPAPVPAAPAAEVDTEQSDDGPAPTIFNNVTVPPIKDIKGTTFDEEIKDGYWFVKHFSPYCGHCIRIAPTWQTLYEYYYTSKPLKGTTPNNEVSLNSFHGYYNFHFGNLDCVAWGDTCEEHDIKALPTFVLYKNGKEMKRFKAEKTMQALGEFVEEALEAIRPGSRPVGGLKYPDAGVEEFVMEALPEGAGSKDKNAAGGAAAGEAHNELANTVPAAPAATPVSKVDATVIEKSVKPTGPAKIANPVGISQDLNQESFLKLVTTSQDPWFIKFYAPWCHHCQALAPNWKQMAKELQGKLNVGEVNCDLNKRLCNEVGVKGYPTIHFFRGGERVEYDGLRGLGDLVSFAKKAVDIGMGVTYVDETAFKKMEETEEVIFVYFYDIATTVEDFAALNRLTLSLIGHAKLVKTDSKALADRFKIHSWPRLVVSRDGRPSYYNALSPRDMRDFRRVLNWMKTVWLPLVPELTPTNSKEIMSNRFVVLGILSRDRTDEYASSKREIKNAAIEWLDKETHAFQLERQEMRDAKQLRIEEAQDRSDQRALQRAKQIKIKISEMDRPQVGFAWVDGVFWERWIRTTYGIDVKEGEKVIINDEEVSFSFFHHTL